MAAVRMRCDVEREGRATGGGREPGQPGHETSERIATLDHDPAGKAARGIAGMQITHHIGHGQPVADDQLAKGVGHAMPPSMNRAVMSGLGIRQVSARPKIA